MSRSTEALLLPLRLGLAPVRRLGNSAIDLASSPRLAQIRLEEQRQDRENREIETAITLAQAVSGKLQSGVVTDPVVRQELEAAVDEAALRIGHIIIEAAGVPGWTEQEQFKRISLLEE